AQLYDKIQWITSYILQTYNVPETYKNKSSLKRMENSEKKSRIYDSQNALKESNLPNRQQQKDILEFEKERNKILKERLSLKKKLLELGGN
ncbi:12037_t:CDS:2, partial [Rhizophagus irregularis]